MRNLKKFLALVLAMMMTLSLMVTANAANKEFEDGETITEEFVEDITVLAGMKVFEGYSDGTFKPTDTVTRAEMAAIVYRLVTGDAEGTSDALHGQYGSFKDVADDKWYAGYVGYCANAGLILGYGDGTFRPSNKVTGYEALVMLLRAMGYDQPNEFSKSDWRTHAASIATQRGLLSKVNATRYQGTLSQPALREVVAEIAFQAAHPDHYMVEYTPAFGYQTTSVSNGVLSSTQNPSLGTLWYGLDYHTGMIVGNQETGESGTLVSTTSQTYVNTAGATVSYDTSYMYPGTAILAAASLGAGTAASAKDAAGNLVAPAGVSVDAKTTLEQYAHKVTVWYDNRVSGDMPTYALFDRATLAKTVYAVAEGNAEGEYAAASDVVYLSNVDTSKAKLGLAAQAAGFKVDLAKDKAYWSDRYSCFYVDTASAAADLLGQAYASHVNMYTLVSNSADKSVDAVIKENIEVAKIMRKNTTALTPNLILGGTGATTDDSWSAFTNTKGTPTKGKIDLENLVEGSTKDVGATVTATQVLGTQKDLANRVYNNAAYDVAGAVFRLKAPVESVTKTVVSYRADTGTDKLLNEITFSDGTTLKRSGIADRGTVGSTTTHESNVINECLRTLTGDNVSAGVTYEIAIDAAGRFLGGVPTNEHTFLYGTYADYTVGGLGTGDLDYSVSGADWDAKDVLNHPLISFGTVSGTPKLYPSLLDGPLSNAYGIGAGKISINQKGLSVDKINDSFNRGFMIDGDGNMYDYAYATAMNLPWGQRQFVGEGYTFNTSYTGTKPWEITATDVARGVARVKNCEPTTPNFAAADQSASNVDYLLTNETKFIVVSGTGSSTRSIQVYNGIKELVGSGTSATISFRNNDAPGTNLAGNESCYASANEVWFRTTADKYNNAETANNNVVTEVILSAANLNQYDAANVYFSDSDSAIANTTLVGTDPAKVKQYRLWKDGVPGYYWIDTTVSFNNTDNPSADGTDHSGAAAFGTNIEKNGFYTLAPYSTANGVTIYRAVERVNNVACGTWAANTYDGITLTYQGFSNFASAIIGNGVYNVTNAKVGDVDYITNTTPQSSVRNELKTVEDIAMMISSNQYSTVVDVCIAFDNNFNVSAIYVVDTD